MAERTHPGSDRRKPMSESTTSEELEVGTVLEDKYRLDAILGRGGMGVVYRATHQLLDKQVAIKVLAPELSGRPDMVNRVMREARAASATGHPNVIDVTDMGQHDGVPFFVMELLRGDNLSHVLARKQRLPVKRAAGIVMDVLAALQAVHAKGIIHRDLKPANVMLADDGRGGEVVKVLDFGISKAGDNPDDPYATKTGHVMGTPQHMSPEQARAEKVDARTDIHAVGSLLYTLVVGKPPFEGPTSTAAMARMLQGTYTAASERVPDVPKPLDDVIAKAMAVEPDDRYASAMSRRNALAPFARGEVAPIRSGATDPAFGPPRIEDEQAELEPEPPPPPTRRVHDGMTGPQDFMPPVGRAAAPKAASPRDELLGSDAKLELDTPFDTRKSLPPKYRKPLPWGAIAVVAIVVAGAGLSWMYRDEILGATEDAADAVRGESRSGEEVLILIDTTPKDARVFLDDVQRTDRPIPVPKSETPVTVRVEAPGFAAKQIQVVPQRTRRLKIDLEREGRAGRERQK